MAIKVKAVERLIKFNKNNAGTYRYVMAPEMYSSLAQDKVIREGASKPTPNPAQVGFLRTICVNLPKSSAFYNFFCYLCPIKTVTL